MTFAFRNFGRSDPFIRVNSQVIRNQEWSEPPVMIDGQWVSREEAINVSLTPRADLLATRCDKDWGEAPRYNKDYRVIRWPAGLPPTPETRTVSMFSNNVMVHPATTRYGLPGWKSQMISDISRKRNGNWDKDFAKSRLKSDILACLQHNIPFKTKSVEYKPRDQWIYINGVRAMKYCINTGYIVEFTYSGVYNKVTSLFFRHLGIPVKLVKGKPAYIRPIPGSNEVIPIPLDLNKIYSYTEFLIQNGFFCADHLLTRENLESKRTNGNE